MLLKVTYKYRGKTYEHLLNTDEPDRNFDNEGYMIWIDTNCNHEINLLKDEDYFGEYFIDKKNIKVYAAIFEDIMQDTIPLDIVIGEDVEVEVIEDNEDEE